MLGRKIRRLEKEKGIRNLRWSNPDSTPDGKALLEAVVIRPVRILLTEPLVIMVAVISAVSWGIIYLFAECLLGIYMTMGLSETQASLPFLAIAVGVLFTFFPRLWDMSVVKTRRRRGEHIEPYVLFCPWRFLHFYVENRLTGKALSFQHAERIKSWASPSRHQP